MNTLKVICKAKDISDICIVKRIDFQWNEISFEIPDNIYMQTRHFEKIEWIDFGTTRWYPNNL